MNTGLQAVASDADRYVAVGLNGKSATAWASTDGLTWEQTTSKTAFAAGELRLTSVIHWPRGFAIAGYAGNEFGKARAAFWVSDDGLTWAQAPDSPDLADARAWSVTAGGPGLVAVGSSGSTEAPGPAVVWTSPDGKIWSRVPESSAFDDARMRAVASVPGIGLVAAGESLAGDRGVVWISPDGIRWSRAPSAPDLGQPGHQIHMYAAIAGGPGAVVVGSATETAQSTAAAVWTSPDGVAWSAQRSGLEFSYSELLAVTPWDSRLLAVGDTGIPDEPIAGVWKSPSDWSH